MNNATITDPEKLRLLNKFHGPLSLGCKWVTLAQGDFEYTDVLAAMEKQHIAKSLLVKKLSREENLRRLALG